MPRRDPAKPSLATVAAEVGVSSATVSHAFNRPERVSPELRERVLRAAARQGYSGPDPAARQLSRGRSDTLGLLFTDELPYAFRDPAAVAFLEGLSRSCSTAGLNLLLISTESADRRPAAVRHAVVDGFVVYSVGAGDPHLAQLLERRLPTVVVDSPRNVPGVDWVGPDDRAGARTLAEHLIGLGHRRIGVLVAGLGPLSGPVSVAVAQAAPGSVAAERILGVADALHAAGLPEPALESLPANTGEHGAGGFGALLDRAPDLTAVCGLMDLLALGALDAARARGLLVPHDLTVTGYDDIPEAAARGLTTVTQPLRDKGRIAGELYLSARPGGASRRRVLPTHLTIRATSGPPRS